MRLFAAAILTSVVSGCAVGQAYAIQTFAGGGLPVNIPGTSASLRLPTSVAVDAAGNLYFPDGRNVVLRLDAATGVLAVAAGNETFGLGGEGGTPSMERSYKGI
jgi:hypothetical protein